MVREFRSFSKTRRRWSADDGQDAGVVEHDRVARADGVVPDHERVVHWKVRVGAEYDLVLGGGGGGERPVDARHAAGVGRGRRGASLVDAVGACLLHVLLLLPRARHVDHHVLGHAASLQR